MPLTHYYYFKLIKEMNVNTFTSSSSQGSRLPPSGSTSVQQSSKRRSDQLSQSSGSYQTSFAKKDLSVNKMYAKYLERFGPNSASVDTPLSAVAPRQEETKVTGRGEEQKASLSPETPDEGMLESTGMQRSSAPTAPTATTMTPLEEKIQKRFPGFVPSGGTAVKPGQKPSMQREFRGSFQRSPNRRASKPELSRLEQQKAAAEAEAIEPQTASGSSQSRLRMKLADYLSPAATNRVPQHAPAPDAEEVKSDPTSSFGALTKIKRREHARKLFNALDTRWDLMVTYRKEMAFASLKQYKRPVEVISSIQSFGLGEEGRKTPAPILVASPRQDLEDTAKFESIESARQSKEQITQQQPAHSSSRKQLKSAFLLDNATSTTEWRSTNPNGAIQTTETSEESKAPSGFSFKQLQKVQNQKYAPFQSMGVQIPQEPEPSADPDEPPHNLSLKQDPIHSEAASTPEPTSPMHMPTVTEPLEFQSPKIEEGKGLTGDGVPRYRPRFSRDSFTGGQRPPSMQQQMMSPSLSLSQAEGYQYLGSSQVKKSKGSARDLRPYGESGIQSSYQQEFYEGPVSAHPTDFTQTDESRVFHQSTTDFRPQASEHLRSENKTQKQFERSIGRQDDLGPLKLEFLQNEPSSAQPEERKSPFMRSSLPESSIAEASSAPPKEESKVTKSLQFEPEESKKLLATAEPHSSKIAQRFQPIQSIFSHDMLERANKVNQEVSDKIARIRQMQDEILRPAAHETKSRSSRRSGRDMSDHDYKKMTHELQMSIQLKRINGASSDVNTDAHSERGPSQQPTPSEPQRPEQMMFVQAKKNPALAEYFGSIQKKETIQPPKIPSMQMMGRNLRVKKHCHSQKASFEVRKSDQSLDKGLSQLQNVSPLKDEQSPRVEHHGDTLMPTSFADPPQPETPTAVVPLGSSRSLADEPADQPEAATEAAVDIGDLLDIDAEADAEAGARTEAEDEEEKQDPLEENKNNQDVEFISDLDRHSSDLQHLPSSSQQQLQQSAESANQQMEQQMEQMEEVSSMRELDFQSDGYEGTQSDHPSTSQQVRADGRRESATRRLVSAIRRKVNARMRDALGELQAVQRVGRQAQPIEEAADDPNEESKDEPRHGEQEQMFPLTPDQSLGNLASRRRSSGSQQVVAASTPQPVSSRNIRPAVIQSPKEQLVTTSDISSVELDSDDSCFAASVEVIKLAPVKKMGGELRTEPSTTTKEHESVIPPPPKDRVIKTAAESVARSFVTKRSKVNSTAKAPKSLLQTGETKRLTVDRQIRGFGFPTSFNSAASSPKKTTTRARGSSKQAKPVSRNKKDQIDKLAKVAEAQIAAQIQFENERQRQRNMELAKDRERKTQLIFQKKNLSGLYPTPSAQLQQLARQQATKTMQGPPSNVDRIKKQRLNIKEPAKQPATVNTSLSKPLVAPLGTREPVKHQSAISSLNNFNTLLQGNFASKVAPDQLTQPGLKAVPRSTRAVEKSKASLQSSLVNQLYGQAHVIPFTKNTARNKSTTQRRLSRNASKNSVRSTSDLSQQSFRSRRKIVGFFDKKNSQLASQAALAQPSLTSQDADQHHQPEIAYQNSYGQQAHPEQQLQAQTAAPQTGQPFIATENLLATPARGESPDQLPPTTNILVSKRQKDIVLSASIQTDADNLISNRQSKMNPMQTPAPLLTTNSPPREVDQAARDSYRGGAGQEWLAGSSNEERQGVAAIGGVLSDVAGTANHSASGSFYAVDEQLLASQRRSQETAGGTDHVGRVMQADELARVGKGLTKLTSVVAVRLERYHVELFLALCDMLEASDGEDGE